MNATGEPASPPSVVTHQARQAVAQWLKHHGPMRVRKTDPRRVLVERYPQGLITEAELEALLGVWYR